MFYFHPNCQDLLEQISLSKFRTGRIVCCFKIHTVKITLYTVIMQKEIAYLLTLTSFFSLFALGDVSALIAA